MPVEGNVGDRMMNRWRALLMAGIDSNWQGAFVGVFIILAVLLGMQSNGRSLFSILQGLAAWERARTSLTWRHHATAIATAVGVPVSAQPMR